MVGLTTTSPLELNFPKEMSRCTQGENWVYNENRIGYQTKVIDEINGNLDDLKVNILFIRYDLLYRYFIKLGQILSSLIKLIQTNSLFYFGI